MERTSTIGRQIEREESLMNANKQNENQYKDLLEAVDVMNSEKLNSSGLSVNVVNSLKLMKRENEKQ